MGSEREQAVENMRDAIRGAFANSRHLHRMDPDVAQLVTEEIMGELFREDSRWVFGALASPPAAPPELAKVREENDRLRAELEAFRPMTPQEVGAAIDAVMDEEPLSDERIREMVRYAPGSDLDRAEWTAERDRLRAAMAKINDIRNSIVGLQTVNWSEHVCPLVAALKEAGISGMAYPESRERFGTMLERTVAAEAERDRLRAAVEKAERALKAIEFITEERLEAGLPAGDKQLWQCVANIAAGKGGEGE